MMERMLGDIGVEFVKPEGNGQLLCVCPDCRTKHLYVNRNSGLWDCKRGCGKGNLFELVRKVTGWQDRECFEFLEKHGYKTDSNPVPIPKPKDISWFTRQLRSATPGDIQKLCEVKQISDNALLKYRPLVHKNEPIICIPAYDPSNGSVCGYLRVGNQGQLVRLKNGKAEKYPAIGEHGLYGLPWLETQNTETIIFCEAWRDALAAVEAGFYATASSGGASTFKDSWLSVFKDKTVYIVMDADEPGQKAAQRAAAKINGVAQNVFIVNLPYEVTESHGKDLHDYLVVDKGDINTLLDNAKCYEVKSEVDDDLLVLADDHPDTIAAAFEKWSVEQCGVRHKYNIVDGWSVYIDDKYQPIEEEQILGYIRKFICRAKVKKQVKRPDGTFVEHVVRADKKLKSVSSVNNVLAWLKSPGLCNVNIRPSLAAPSCLDGSVNIDNVIALNNGLLDIENCQKPVLRPFSDNIYTFNYLPFDYDPDAKAPTWIWALGQYFRNEDGSPDGLVPDILHQWIKKILLRDVSHQKIFSLIGRRRSGKGTIGRTISRLVGQRNIVPITISSLSREFGLQPLLNKQLGIMWDAAITGKSGSVSAAVEILKSISGEDTFTVNRKNLTQLTGIKLNLTILMIANKVLDLRDSTGALAGRFSFLETTNSFYGYEDPAIEEKIAAELPGIFNLVLGAPEGRIMEHPKSQVMQREFEELSSPYLAFINDWCTLDEDSFIPVDVLWAYYCQWAHRNNHCQLSPQKFKIEFNGVHDEVKRYRPQLSNGEILRLRREYNLDARPGRGVEIATRSHCYRGIDVNDTLKNGLMVWDGPG